MHKRSGGEGAVCAVLSLSVSYTHLAQTIVTAVKQALEQTPPELSGDIMETGIVLSGGTSALRGLDRLISLETGMPVRLAEDHMDCVVRGTSMVIDGAAAIYPKQTTMAAESAG